MDLTQGTEKEKRGRSRRMMLWFAIVSLIMGFAGLTSAYVVSSKREDWLDNVQLPQAFVLSTIIIALSSLTFYVGRLQLKKGNKKQVDIMLWATLALGIAFIGVQFFGFSQMLGEGYYFTGPTSNIKMSYVFLIAFVHIVHVVAGLIALLVVIVNQLRGKYAAEERLGYELGETFWHFLGVLWLYLVLFMFFVK